MFSGKNLFSAKPSSNIKISIAKLSAEIVTNFSRLFFLWKNPYFWQLISWLTDKLFSRLSCVS